MEMLWYAGGALLVVGIVALICWRPLRHFGRQIHLERARESFRLQRERMEAKFLQSARSSGKPRGLLWKDCQFESPVEFVRDKKTGEIAALVEILVQFEAVEGGDMEDNPNVDTIRNASAVFSFHGGHWHTVGKALFNMNPSEAVEHFKNQYERAAT
jgi:hypothetical protein